MAKKKSKNASVAERAKIKHVTIVLIDECLKCNTICEHGAGYLKKYRAAKDSNKAFMGKGVPCHRA